MRDKARWGCLLPCLGIEQKGEGIVNGGRRVDRLSINNVVVVQDEGKVVREWGNLIESGNQNRFNGWEQTSAHQCQGIPADLRIQHL